MKIVFIGAGNLATRLSLAMQRVGMQIGQVYSHTEASAVSWQHDWGVRGRMIYPLCRKMAICMSFH